MHKSEQYKDDQLDGPRQLFHKNGALWQESHFVNGKPEGVQKTYYANGKIKKTESYADGERNGTSERYAENGRLRAKEVHMSGELQGEPIQDNKGNEDWIYDADEFKNASVASSQPSVNQRKARPINEEDYFKNN